MTETSKFESSLIEDENILKSFSPIDLFEQFNKLSINKKKLLARENSILILDYILNEYSNTCKYYPNILESVKYLLILCSDNKLEDKAKASFKKVFDLFYNHSSTLAYSLLDKLLEGINVSNKLTTKKVSFEHLMLLTNKCNKEIKQNMHFIVPKIADSFSDLSKEVKELATQCLSKYSETIENIDIDPFIPRLIEVFKDHSTSTEVIHSLASVTFVQEVCSSTLSIIVPVLVLGFRTKQDATKRLSAVIVTNMLKLVNNPNELEPYIKILLPILENVSNNVSEPEARSVCLKSFNSLKELSEKINSKEKEILSLNKLLLPLNDAQKIYVNNLITSLIQTKNLDNKLWNDLLGNLDYKEVFEETLLKLKDKDDQIIQDEKDNAELLCDCQFTLAYGSKILLHNTRLVLKRGYRYGLLGGNGSGKSTLLRSIANEQVDGFPPSSVLKTVFVEADILGELSHLSCLDYIFADDRIKTSNISRDEIKQSMLNVGFTETMCNDPVTTLSGGWRIKLALCRAMLQKADILLLDEPTNHLDVVNIAWVENYLINLKDVTSIIISHNRNVLDNCCTHIIDIDNFKLHIHKGNLSDYAKVHPHALSYFEMKSNSGFKFKFPPAGFVDGVKQAGTVLMRMENVNFKYREELPYVITDVNIKVSMASRVGCVGRNGQGKSTMIKLLTGELEPVQGTVWRKNGLRFGYVSQHSFHHIEDHLNKSATEYILWRFNGGVDKEILEKDTYILTQNESDILKEPKEIEIKDEKGNIKKVKWVVDKLTGERKNVGRDLYQYEVKWEHGGSSFYSSDKLIEWGFGKVIKKIDLYKEAEVGLYKRNLNQKNVEELLKDFGLEPEFASHTRMNSLSASQKLKVVLAAAVWQNPSIIILDEPTNYFSRENMIALSEGLKDYNGGFIVISHNDDFIQHICKEFWTLENGKLNVHGDQEWMINQLKNNVEFKMVDEIVDSHGNVNKVKGPQKSLSNKDKKQLLKKLEYKKKNDIPLDNDEEELWETLKGN